MIAVIQCGIIRRSVSDLEGVVVMAKRVVQSVSLTVGEAESFRRFAIDRGWSLSDAFRYLALQVIPGFGDVCLYEKDNVRG